MTRFEGRNAVVTGGTRGIGRAISLELAASGAAVQALYARDRASAEALEQEARQRGLAITTIRGDLAHDETFLASVARVRSACATIDFLVHAAASGVHKPAMELSDRHLRWTFEVNLFAVHRLTRELRDRIPRGGRIIGITSPGGSRVVPQYAAVGATKGALEALFRHYARELAPDGITVNLVCPGLVLTEAIRALPQLDERIRRAVADTPTGALTEPGQVASIVRSLCDEESSQITGQTIVVDGGKGLLA